MANRATKNETFFTMSLQFEYCDCFVVRYVRKDIPTNQEKVQKNARPVR